MSTRKDLRTDKQRPAKSFEKVFMTSFYSTILFGLSLPASVLSYSRYNTQEGVIKDPKGLRTLPITPFGGLPLQDKFYNYLIIGHFISAMVILVLFTVQMFRRKGDALHVKVGKATQYLGLLFILEAFVMLFRHQRSDFALYDVETPGVLPPILIWPFGMSVLTSNLHLFFVGRSPSHRLALGGMVFWAIALAGVLSLATTFYAYAYMTKNLLSTQGYQWEVNFEMACLYSAYPIYDVLMLNGLWQWFRTKSLIDWREHHAMSAVIAASGVLAPIMLFVAHDARLFWTYPGLNSMARLFIQLLPQLCLLGFYAERIAEHIVKLSQAPTRKKAE
jgi:uncharacterized membrane protein